MIIERLEVGPLATNCYIVGDESNKEGMIIDPGAEANHILKRVKELDLKIKLIVLTHGHMDHFGALKEVKEVTDADFGMHANDTRIFQAGLAMAEGSRHPPQTLASPGRLLKDGDSLDIGNLNFLILHTPGHSPGGICLSGEGVVFTGDTLFNFCIGRFDLPGGDGHQLMNSIYTKLMVLPDNTSVYPGHGSETTIGTERQRNPFLRG